MARQTQLTAAAQAVSDMRTGCKQLRHAAANIGMPTNGPSPHTSPTYAVGPALLRLADFLQYGQPYRDLAAHNLRALADAIDADGQQSPTTTLQPSHAPADMDNGPTRDFDAYSQ